MDEKLSHEQGRTELKAHNRQQVPAQIAASQRHQPEDRWWFVETWKDGREVFKALVEHVFAFLLLVGTLILFHYIFKFLDLRPDRKEILETIDFVSIASALVIFGVSFLFRLVYEAIKNGKKTIQAERLLKLQMERVLAKESGLAGKSLETFIDQELFRMSKLAGKSPH